MKLSHVKKIHFVGIGGAGMSGLADILIAMGHNISGSDREQSETTEYLATRGVQIFIGHAAQNLSEADFVVYSSAVPEDNPEIQQARQKKIPRIKRAALLGQLMLKNKGIAIAGTHGKTTTTSMAGHILICNNYDPTVVVGGKMNNSQTNAHLGKGEYFIAEADEYDRSFLTLFPFVSVVTSLEADHLDIYGDMGNIKKTFSQFINQTAFDGLVILNADDKNVMELSENCVPQIQTYGISNPADITAENITFLKSCATFDVIKDGAVAGNVKLNIPGKHNISNALAATAVGLYAGLSFTDIKKALATFSGVQRRFEFKGQANGILFFDDYAHHPTEVMAAISAAKSGWKNRLVVVFQPHLFSRTKDFYIEFAAALSAADKVILVPVYAAREKEIPGVNSALIAQEMGSNCTNIDNNNAINIGILEEIKEGDLLLTMGAGDIWKYGVQVYEQLKNRGK
jgi:UDP-N-acetylmuramate--alanine ligase